MSDVSEARPWRQAVVIGGGVAGLLAARALADHFEAVTLFERDAYPDANGSRRGVPQGRHVHAILARGLVALDRFFPGLTDEMIKGGAIPFDGGRDLQWYYFGGYRPRVETGTRVVLFTRPFLEANLLRRLRQVQNVKVRDGMAVERLLASDGGRRVSGVVVRPAEGGQAEEIAADLVVDAAGRGSRAARWLADLGYPEPASTQIRIDLSYVSRFYRRRPDDLPGATAVYVVPKPPHEKRGGAALPVEGDRWIVSLYGYFAQDHPPTDEAGFLEFARSLPAPDVHDLIARLEPLTAPVAYQIPKSERRDYASMKRFPERFVLVGDTVSAFNPVFAQGMTVASLEAERLGSALAHARHRASLDGFARSFMKAESRVIELPWRLAGHEDFRYPETRGRSTFGTRIANRYTARMHKVAEQDLTVYRTFIQAMHMTRSPFILFAPAILLRVLRGPRPNQRLVPDAQRIPAPAVELAPLSPVADKDPE